MPYLEEESDDEDLQCTHAHHETTLDQAEVDDPPLGVADSVEVSIFAGPEILLVSGNGRDLARDLVDGFLQSRRALWRCTLLGWQLRPRLVLDLRDEARSVPESTLDIRVEGGYSQ